MNIVILSCGPGLKEVVEEYGHSSEWIPNTINNSSINFIVNKVYENDFSSIDIADAFIITGSKYSVYDELDWIQQLKQVTKKIIKSNKAVLGICFGHQIIASALGGIVQKNKLGWELGSYNITLTDAGKKSLLFTSFNDNDIVYESHQDVVVKLPHKCVELAFTEKANQSFVYKNNVFGVQFHPEFSYDVTRKLMDLRIKNGVKVDCDNLCISTNSKYILKNFINYVLRGKK